jgi:hypothetical protein
MNFVLKSLLFFCVIISVVMTPVLSPAGASIDQYAGSFSQEDSFRRAPDMYPDDYIDPIPEGADKAPPLTETEKRKLALFKEPTSEELLQTNFQSEFGKVDPNREVPDTLLEKALAFYKKNSAHIDNKDYLTIVAFSWFSAKSRMFIIDMRSGHVTKLHVAHGSGSDPRNLGVPAGFSNRVGSKASSLGFYRAAEPYYGKNGLSVRLDGLSSTNSRARERAIVVHGARYVYDSDIKPGRSAGCLAVSMNWHRAVAKMIKQGSIIYADVTSR